MNISNQIQIIYVPWWIRTVIALLMVLSITLCGFLFYRALVDGDKPDWIAAGAYLLGIVFPILLIVIVVAGASFGERSIIKRTERMLVETIPYHLQFIPEETRHFVDFRSFSRSGKTAEKELAKIMLFHSRGRCHADYIVEAPRNGSVLRLELRVELNVKRANVNIAFRREKLEQLMNAEDFKGAPGDYLRSKFGHSLAIEELQAREAAAGGGADRTTIAYAFNSEFLSRKVDGKDYIVVVATTAVPYDTVWNPSERVFFAQDLMFMIRAFFQENPEIFTQGEAAIA